MKILVLLIICILSTGCVSTRYVERSSDFTKQKPEPVLTNDSLGDIYHGVVVFESSEELKSNPLGCLAVFPITAKDGDMESAAFIRSALHANLSTTGIRLLALQKVDAAMKSSEYITDAASTAIGCDTIMIGEVIEDPESFYGVYSIIRAGANIQIIRVSTGEVLWRGNHTAKLRGGGIPMGFMDVAMNIFQAIRNLTADQKLRVSNDLARRLVTTIPGLKFQDDMTVEPTKIVNIKPPDYTQYLLLRDAINYAKIGENDYAARNLRRAMIIGIAKSDPVAANRAMNLLYTMKLEPWIESNEMVILESKIKSL